MAAREYIVALTLVGCSVTSMVDHPGIPVLLSHMVHATADSHSPSLRLFFPHFGSQRCTIEYPAAYSVR